MLARVKQMQLDVLLVRSGAAGGQDAQGLLVPNALEHRAWASHVAGAFAPLHTRPAGPMQE